MLILYHAEAEIEMRKCRAAYLRLRRSLPELR